MTVREMIKLHEGLRLTPYRCKSGKLTIGWGWNLDNALPLDIAACFRVTGSITEEMAERLLTISIDAAERNCGFIYPGFDGFSKQRRVALIDFVFNLGAGGALKFRKMRKAIEAGDWEEAAKQVQDSLYWRQLGGDPEGTDDGKEERPETIAKMLKGELT